MEGSSNSFIWNEYFPTFDERQFNAWLNQGEASVNAATGGKLNCKFMYLAWSGKCLVSKPCLVPAGLLCQMSVETSNHDLYEILYFFVRHLSYSRK